MTDDHPVTPPPTSDYDSPEGYPRIFPTATGGAYSGPWEGAEAHGRSPLNETCAPFASAEEER